GRAHDRWLGPAGGNPGSRRGWPSAWRADGGRPGRGGTEGTRGPGDRGSISHDFYSPGSPLELFRSDPARAQRMEAPQNPPIRHNHYIDESIERDAKRKAAAKLRSVHPQKRSHVPRETLR